MLEIVCVLQYTGMLVLSSNSKSHLDDAAWFDVVHWAAWFIHVALSRHVRPGPASASISSLSLSPMISVLRSYGHVSPGTGCRLSLAGCLALTISYKYKGEIRVARQVCWRPLHT